MDPSSNLSSLVSRRTFLAGAAASVFARSISAHTVLPGIFATAYLHLAGCSSESGHVHTYALTPDHCEHLGSTAIDALAACASHPALPLLYVARDTSLWEHLPRGVVETYAVECGSRPLRLLAQSPMSLSATGPRSLAVSSCGQYLLASASTGGAWNIFSLAADGVPGSVAVARKETGVVLKSGTPSLPAPHAITFAPQGLYAVGTDPACERMTLLQASPAGIEVVSRCTAPYGLAHSSPVWTADSRYIVAVNADQTSLSIYAVGAMPRNQRAVDIHFIKIAQAGTPIQTLLAHPAEPGVFALRRERGGTRLEFLAVRGSHLAVERETWIPHVIRAMALHSDSFWLASEDRVFRIQCHDLSSVSSWRTPFALHEPQAVITRSPSA